MMNKILRSSNIAGYSQLLSKRFDQFSYDYWPGSYRSATGTMVQSNDGKWYKDLSISGIGACIFGYADREVDESVIAAIKNGVATSLNSELEEEVAECLLRFIPGHSFVRYAKGGGEAMTIAVRIARAYSAKSVVLFSGYHGWSDWYLAANLSNRANLNNHLIKDLDPVGVPKELQGTAVPFEYNKLDDLVEKIEKNRSNLACIVMEPARNGEADIQYLNGVKRLSEDNGIPLIFDEISCGFRQSNGPYSANLGVVPDIYVFAKSIGNGYPIAAITGKASIMNNFNQSFVSSTNWTEAIGLAAAKAVLQRFEKTHPEKKIIELGNYWSSRVSEVAKVNDFNLEISGLPGMKYLSCPDGSDVFRTFFTVFALKRNVLVAGRYYANTAQSKEDLDQYATLLSEAIVAYKSMNANQRLDYSGTVLPSGFNKLGNNND